MMPLSVAEKVCSCAHNRVADNMASIYYGLGMKPVIRMSHECGAIYKIGRKVLIRRIIFEEYLRFRRKSDV